MWHEKDRYLLVEEENADEGGLSVALGNASCILTAFESNEDDATEREGSLVVRIRAFDHAARTMTVVVLDNTTGNNLTSRELVLTLAEEPGEDHCEVIKIEGMDLE